MAHFTSSRRIAVLAGALALGWLAAALPAGAADVKPGSADPAEYGRNYDLRTTLPAEGAPAMAADQARAVDAWRAAVPDLRVEFDRTTGATRTLSNAVGYLTGPRGGADVEAIALGFAYEQLDLLGLTAADLDDYEVTDSVFSAGSAVTHLYLRQRHAGIPLYNGQLHFNVAADSRILSVNNLFVPRLAQAVNTTVPEIRGEDAFAAFAAHLGEVATGARSEPVLMYLATRPGEARLVWNFQAETSDGNHWYDVTVDAVDGQVWTRYDWVADANYRVYQRPVEAPTFTAPLPPADGRTLQVNPQNATASPFGWHDTNGVAGAEFTIMRGNNVHAYDDIDNNNLPPAGEPDCGAPLNCDFAIDLTQAPNQYIPAAVANLFYWNNVIHDVAYLYGFDSAGGNFQVNVYGGGGAGNDDVRAEAQDGSGTNNANFFTPADGSRPRMQMYIWTAPTPDRDGDLDAGIVAHEYGHGISNRLVGGPGNVSCLSNAEQPGEGLSDWWSLFYTFEAANPSIRGIGTYALNQPTNGAGIRTQRYDNDIEPNTNTWTYGSVQGSVIPHGVGEKWGQAYWYAQGRLEDEHGFNADVYAYTGGAGDAGNVRAMYYIVQGLKNSVCSPGFVDVRNGILAAATSSYGGADVCLLWQAFADYGLGFSASQGSSGSINDQTPAFDIPPSCDLIDAGPNVTICAGTNAVQTIGVGGSFTPPVTMSASGNPGATTANFVPNPVVSVPSSTTLTIGNTGGVAAGTYPITVTGNDGGGPVSDTFDLEVFSGNPATVSLVAPANGATNVPVNVTFMWSAATGASEYLLEVATDAAFSNIVISNTVAGTSTTTVPDLPSSSLLYWRVTSVNPCGNGTASAVRSFTTVALPGDCGPGTLANVVYDYGFESGAGGWTVSGSGASNWALSPTKPHSGTMSYFANDIPTVSDQRLESPDFVLPSGQSPLTFQFWNDQEMEDSGTGCYDGGILEISTNGGSTWTQLLDPVLQTDPYDGLVSSSFGNPLAGLNAWCGDPQPYLNSVVDLDAYAGMTVRLRIRFGTDNSVSHPGWYVDDVLVQGCVTDTMPFIDGFESGDTSAWSVTVP